MGKQTTPKQPSSKFESPRSKSGKFIAQISKDLRKSQYDRALKHILNSSPSSAKAFKKLVKKRVRKETKDFTKSATYPSLEKGSQAVDEFTWQIFLATVERDMPILYTTLMAAMPTKPSKRANVVPRIGFILSMLMYTHNPQKFHFIQGLCGVQMWRCGASDKLFRSFNKLGLCQSSNTVRKLIDKFCAETDAELLKWKEEVESNYASARDDKVVNSSPTPLTDNQEEEAHASSESALDGVEMLNEDAADADEEDDDSVWGDEEEDDDYSPTASQVLDSQTSQSQASLEGDQAFMDMSQLSQELQNLDRPVGYALVWDNIQKSVHVRDQGRNNGNKMLLWANGYAAKNRVAVFDDKDTVTLQAKQVPLYSYFPAPDDIQTLQERLNAIVGRILFNHIPHFSSYKDVVRWHIPHEYSAESAMKTETVNLGIIDENPSSTAGVIRIMEAYHTFAPRSSEGAYRVVPTHGDALSVERMNDAKRARAAELSDTNRLEGLEPIPQEFHHRGLMLQNLMDTMFSGKSLVERGTLSQLKNAFGHRNVTTDVMNSFNSVENFIRFVTEGHVVLLTMELLDMKTISDVPRGSTPTADHEEKKAYLDDVCSAIVKQIWLLPAAEEFNQVVEAEVKGDPTQWCFCGEEKEDFVRCSNYHCALAQWYHTSCIGVSTSYDEDWYCSQECQDSGVSIFCLCKSHQEGEFIQCGRGAECQKGVKFHVQCLQLAVVPDDQWFCSSVCAEEAGQEDYVRNYSIAVTWCGLLDFCHRYVGIFSLKYVGPIL